MKVDVVGTTLVAPSEDTPRRELWLSNLDLAVPKTHTPLVYYYPAPAADGAAFFAPERLEAALARALVPFYPLAGRLGVGEGGRLQIDCDAQGALFVVARADFAGDDVFNDDYEPSPEVRRMFVPFAASGDPPCVMAMFQAQKPETTSNLGRREYMEHKIKRKYYPDVEAVIAICWPTKVLQNQSFDNIAIKRLDFCPVSENEMRKGYPVIMTASVYCIF